MDPDEIFVWDPDFPDLLNSRCRHKVYENIYLESQDPRFNANPGLDKILSGPQKLRFSNPIKPKKH